MILLENKIAIFNKIVFLKQKEECERRIKEEREKAAKILEERLISVRVVDMYSIKPIDRELIVKCAKETGAIVCAEEHNIHGGLGSAVSEVLAYEGCGVPTEFVGIQDTFTESAPYKELLAKYGLDADGVIEGIEKVLDRK